MQVPIRKSDKIPRIKPDPLMTRKKFDELQAKLNKWKTINRPREAAEVARLALMGDFSENAGYQVAKGRLRGLNQRIIDTADLLARAEIIESNPDDCQKVRIGHCVTVARNGIEKDYRILGSAESDPLRGIISHSSPLGAALLSHSLGETISLESNGQVLEYKIIRIT